MDSPWYRRYNRNMSKRIWAVAFMDKDIVFFLDRGEAYRASLTAKSKIHSFPALPAAVDWAIAAKAKMLANKEKFKDSPRHPKVAHHA